jgi:flotillin
MAAHLAETARAKAQAERRRILSRITANAQAQTTGIEAAATLKRKQARIEALRARIAAQTARSPDTAGLARLDAVPKIVAEMVKPAEKIGNINVTQVGTVEGSRGAVLQALESVLEQIVQVPGLNRLLDRARDIMRPDKPAAAARVMIDRPMYT